MAAGTERAIPRTRSAAEARTVRAVNFNLERAGVIVVLPSNSPRVVAPFGKEMFDSAVQCSWAHEPVRRRGDPRTARALLGRCRSDVLRTDLTGRQHGQGQEAHELHQEEREAD